MFKFVWMNLDVLEDVFGTWGTLGRQGGQMACSELVCEQLIDTARGG